MTARLFTFYLCFIVSLNALAQLSPPGLGETKTAFWSAIGVKQKLDEKNSSTTYVGMGRISGTEGNDLFNHPSIIVLNQEFYHAVNSKWKYSYALSYRRQHDYDEGFKEKGSQNVNQEFRIYGRLAYTVNLGRLKWTTTLRQEMRKFYTHNFSHVPEDLQLRTRLKTQLLMPLDDDAENSIMGSAESLFTIADDSKAGWSGPAYKESRFCLYYCYSPKELPITFDVGYMNALVGYGNHMYDASYLAVDIIIKNPFSHS